MESICSILLEHWSVWLVAVTLVVAAVIDGLYLKVPNWLTIPMIISGLVFSFTVSGWNGLGWSLLGTVVGLILLLIVYSIGGMGAGDVKLLAGIGAWMHVEHTFWIFIATTIVGGIMAVFMIAASGRWKKHFGQMKMITQEIVDVRDPETLFAIAKERKPRMMLLPYGVPMTIAALGYFATQGLLW
ncbi:MAG: prepilin peptidase [Planctomycetaceae bacterium]|nr:prepilin peptidase [Planctomycetaceae bacterium]